MCIYLSPLNMPYFFFHIKLPVPARYWILIIHFGFLFESDYSVFYFLLVFWFLSVSFGEDEWLNVQATLSYPSLNHCTIEIRFNYFILKMNKFLKQQWKNFVTKMYFLIAQSRGFVEGEIDETGSLFRNNEFLVNLNIK